jgi:tRNA nucleotidyltransferase (CCA-adding enzyme)
MVDNGEVNHLVAERVWAEFNKALACDTPARFFTVLAGCGALATLFPEVAGLAEAAPTHGSAPLRLPVLESATALRNDVAIRFAALACDLDNGCAGSFPVAALDALCDRLRVPNACRNLATMALRHRARTHRIATLPATDVLDLLTALDAFRRGERLADFIAVCAAEAHATEHTTGDYPPADLLERAWQAASAVRPDTRDKTGPAIGAALREARIAAIEKLLE